MFSFAKAFSKLAACSCQAGSLVRGASGEFFGIGIPARNRDVSLGGGGPVDCIGRAASRGAAIGAGVGALRCHGHLMAIALLESRASITRIIKTNRGERELFIGGD